MQLRIATLPLLIALTSACSSSSGSEEATNLTDGEVPEEPEPSAAIEPIGVLELGGPECLVAVDPEAPFRTSGVLDFVEGSFYTGVLLVRTDATILSLVSVEVELDVEGNVLGWLDAWEELPSAEITMSVPGYHAAPVSLTHAQLNLTIGADLTTAPRGTRKRAVATVRVHGTTSEGQSVISAPWQYPMDLCYGCLVTFPEDALTTQSDGSVLCEPPMDGPLCGEIDCPCVPGSDDPIDCRLCAGGPSPPSVCTTPL